MSADIFTKGFTGAVKWNKACELINVVDFSKIKITPATWQLKEELAMDHIRSDARFFRFRSRRNGTWRDLVRSDLSRRNAERHVKGDRRKKQLMHGNSASAPCTDV